MSRQLCLLWLICALCGCGDKSTPAPAAGTGAAAATQETAKAGNSPAAPEKATDDPAVRPASEPAKGESPEEVAVNNKPKDTPALETEPKDTPKEEPKQEEDQGLTVQEAFTQAQQLAQKQDIAGVVKVLERALPGNANDFSLLFQLARFSSMLASANPQKPDYAMHQQAAAYARRALKANPVLAENPNIQNTFAPIYYNEACALALDNKSDAALKVLGEAIELGFKDVALLDRDTDLESVRALAGYADFRTQVDATLRAKAEAARAALEKEIETMLASNKPFDFDFELTDIEGQPISKADFAGKVLIVDVWGTWCPPCRMEIPHFVELQKNYKEAGLAIVGLNSERTKDEEAALKLIQEFHQKNAMNYRCAIVAKDTLGKIPEFNAFPTTMFFDRSGNVRAKIVGYNDYEKLEIIVKKLLDEKTDSAGG